MLNSQSGPRRFTNFLQVRRKKKVVCPTRPGDFLLHVAQTTLYIFSPDGFSGGSFFQAVCVGVGVGWGSEEVFSNMHTCTRAHPRSIFPKRDVCCIISPARHPPPPPPPFWYSAKKCPNQFQTPSNMPSPNIHPHPVSNTTKPSTRCEFSKRTWCDSM